MHDDMPNIPYWVWYTGRFLFYADRALEVNPEKPIGEVYQQFLQHEEGLSAESGFQLRNQGTTLMLAYGLLVLPRELWERDGLPEFEFKTRDEFTFIIDTVGAQSNTRQFIRCMRNALSHANIKIIAPAQSSQENTFTFWNRTRSGDIDFKVETSWSGLIEFIVEAGRYYINKVKPTADSIG